MRIKCKHCHCEYEVDAQMIGEKVRCSQCQEENIVQNPNLQPCPDCFAMISKRAAVCPKCGAVLREIGNGAMGADMCKREEEDTLQEEHVAIYHPSTMNYLFSIITGIILIPLLIGIGILAYIAIEIYCTSYEITNKRLIVRKGWIAKYQNEIWIKDMRAVNFSQSIWQRIIGVGDISVGTAATAGNEIFIVGVDDPAKIVDEINSLRKS